MRRAAHRARATHGGVLRVLKTGHREPVADEQPLQVDLDVAGREVLIALGDGVGYRGRVVATIGLARDEEGPRLERGVRLEEGLQEGVAVDGNVGLVLVVLRAVREADARGLVQPHNGSVAVPAVRVEDGLARVRARLGHEAWTIFGVRGLTVLLK